MYKKVSGFPVPSRDVTYHLARNNLIIPGQGKFGKLHPGWDGITANFFLQCVTRLPLILKRLNN
jgi:hypothetical protein